MDITASSIEQAMNNQTLNGISNATFYHGKAEDYIRIMLEFAQSRDVVAIVDPPRAGLRKYQFK